MVVNSTSSMQQMGMGNGSGKMSDIMQSLSQDEKVQLRDKMSNLSMEDRQSVISQMQEVDKSSGASEDYLQTLLDMIDSSGKGETKTSSTSFSVYA